MNEQEFYMEGNNGGDYIYLKQLSDDELVLEIGACCVQTVKCKIPVEWLTQLITNLVITARGDVDPVRTLGLRYMVFDNIEYNNLLISKIKNLKQSPGDRLTDI